MNTEFSLQGRQLTLQRWPIAQKNRTLQAWDSADEYLINHVCEQDLLPVKGRVLIINDSFGALTCFFADIAPLNFNDSYVAQQGIKHNIAANDLNLSPEQLLDSTSDLPDDIALVLIKVPKNNGYLLHILTKLTQHLPQYTPVIAAGKTTDIHTSTIKLLEKYLGPTTTSLAKKKSRLMFSSVTQPHVKAPYPVEWPLEGSQFTIVNHANVFSRDSLDIGARLLLNNIPNDCDDKQVVDLGCGNGVIGLSLLAKNPQAKVTFVDESYMAVASAEDSVTLNLPQLESQCRFVVDDCMTSLPDNAMDLVICNPPFHQQQAVTDHIAWQMFVDARRVLKKGGRLVIVGNRNLAYHVKLKRLFGNSKTLDANKKFTVLSATKG